MKNLLFLLIVMGLGYAPIMAQQCGSGSTTVSTSASSAISTTSYSRAGGDFDQRAWSNFMADFRNNSSYVTAETYYAQHDGSPYMFDEYQTATLVLNDGRELPNVKVNYDAYQESIIAQNDKGEKIILDGRFYKEIVVDTDREQIVFAKVNPQAKDKFYQVLYGRDGFAFYKDYTTHIREGVSHGLTTVNKKFINRSKYYVVDGDSKPIAVNLKKKKVFKHFPEIEMIAINEVLKKNKLKLKDESDYMTLFAQL